MQIFAWVIIIFYLVLGISFIAALILKIIERIKEGKKDKYKNIKQ